MRQRIIAAALAALFVAACGAGQKGPGGRAPRSPGVYKTTIHGGAAGGGGGGGGGGSITDNKLLMGGLITLGVSYGLTIVGGQVAESMKTDEIYYAIEADATVDALWVPVFGPWRAVAHNEGTVRQNCLDYVSGDPFQPGCDIDTVTAGTIAAVVGGVAQGVGATLTVIGILRHGKGGGGGGISDQVVVTPHATATGGGLVVSGSF